MNSTVLGITFQIVIFILTSLVLNFIKKLFHKRIPARLEYYDFWPILAGYYAAINLGWGLFPFVVIGWTLIGIGLVVTYLIKDHEVLYKKFWFAFWRITVVYSFIAFTGSLIWRIMG